MSGKIDILVCFLLVVIAILSSYLWYQLTDYTHRGDRKNSGGNVEELSPELSGRVLRQLLKTDIEK